jgi:hypothetical protein
LRDTNIHKVFEELIEGVIGVAVYEDLDIWLLKQELGA